MVELSNNSMSTSLDVCEIPLSNADCHKMLSAWSSLLYFHVSIAITVDRDTFKQDIQEKYKDCKFTLYNTR